MLWITPIEAVTKISHFEKGIRSVWNSLSELTGKQAHFFKPINILPYYYGAGRYSHCHMQRNRYQSTSAHKYYITLSSSFISVYRSFVLFGSKWQHCRNTSTTLGVRRVSSKASS